MHNMVYLIGRLSSDIIKDDKGGYFTLAVQRSYKNAEGVYETDLINCILYGNIAEKTIEYCQQGDLVGIKGKIETVDYKEENINVKIPQVIVDKISFLSSKKDV